MARQLDRLTALKAQRLIRQGKPIRYHDGGGLYLDVKGAGEGFWLFRYGRGGSKSMSFGPAHAVGLTGARAKRKAAHALLADGRDPKIEREQIRMAAKVEAAKRVTFTAAADNFHANHNPAWRSTRHAAEWRQSLATYAEPVIGALPISEIDTSLVLKVVEPIWRSKTVTASRVRQRLESVLDFARARGWREGDNPARWKGHLENLLPKPRKIAPVQHYAAMPYADVPAFMAQLRQVDSVAARCLEFTILTASRNSEARKATFDEIVRDVWTVPAERMKRGRPHRVPLSPPARAIVERMRQQTNGEFVFPGTNGPIGDTSLNEVLGDLKVAVTVHGFRSSFRDWAAESGFARELAELALSHRVGDDTETSYFRSDLLERRAALMAAWARHCSGKAGAVVPMVRARHG